VIERCGRYAVPRGGSALENGEISRCPRLAACVLVGCHQDPTGPVHVSAGTSGYQQGQRHGDALWQGPTNTDGARSPTSRLPHLLGMNADDLTQTVQLTSVGSDVW